MSKYYKQDDHPTTPEKHRMWAGITDALPSKSKSDPVISLHWTSFWIGQAAAVLGILACIGLYFLIATWQQPSQSDSIENQLQRTYTLSVQDLQTIKPSVALAQSEIDPQKKALESRLRGLDELDKMIEEIRRDMIINGSTEAKRNRIKQLYATKLDFMKAIILNEEVSL